MNPISAVILAGLIVLVVALSRRGALLALLAGALYLSETQAVNVLGLNLFPTRLLELALFVRVTARREWSFLRLNRIDRAFVVLYVYTTVVFLLRSSDGRAFQVGEAVDAFLVYFSCRTLINSPEDLRWLLRSFILLLIPFVLVVIIERRTTQSPLAFMGWGATGAAEGWMRDDRIRCFGSFRNPSLLGTISVSFIPMFIGMAFRKADRIRAALGIALCLIIVWAANSGGPVGGVAFGFLAWSCWRLRRKMRAVRWGIVVFVALAAVLMKAPVWYLLARVSSVTGGDGWHRSYLMEVSFNNLGKWWFAGMPITDTIGWFPYFLKANGGADITNVFISFGLTAGGGAIALLILLLSRAFGGLGKALQSVRAISLHPSEDEFLLWGLGCMLAAHIVNWLGITYFDQTYVFWCAQLAVLVSLSDWYFKTPSEAVLEATEGESASQLPDHLQETAPELH